MYSIPGRDHLTTGQSGGTSARATGAGSVVDSLRIHGRARVPFSVEFNPPRDAVGEARLWRAVRQFERMHPAVVSMTYGRLRGDRGAAERLSRGVPRGAAKSLREYAHMSVLWRFCGA